MTPKEYLEQSTRTESHKQLINAHYHSQLIHAGLGMATETAEFLDALKKFHYYDKQFDEANLKEELGDLLWYIAMACRTLGCTFEELMEMNIGKLKIRYPEKFTTEKALNRNLEEEEDFLKGKTACTTQSEECESCQ